MIFGRQQTSSGTRWIESLIITVSGPVLGSLVSPDDPYLLHAAFPWLMLAPLAVGLQHGLWAGLFSSALLCVGALYQSLSSGPLPPEFTSWCIGCGVVAVVAGQVRDSVRARSEQLQMRAEELQDRLERSERTRHVIQLSHAKLAERVASGRSSLVAAIDGATLRMAEARTMQELGQVVLDVVSAQGNLHSASLYIAGRDIALLVVTPVATFGSIDESAARHPLVMRAFTTGKLAAIVDAGEPMSADKSVLAAVPLITSQRTIVGVVAIHQLPFMAFHAEHLNQLFVLAGHLADMLFDRYREVYAAVPSEVSEVSGVVKTVRHAPSARELPVPVSAPMAHTQEDDHLDVEIEFTPAPVMETTTEESLVVQVIAPVVVAEPLAEAEAELAPPRAPAITLPPPKAKPKTATVARIALKKESVPAPAMPVVEEPAQAVVAETIAQPMAAEAPAEVAASAEAPSATIEIAAVAPVAQAETPVVAAAAAPAEEPKAVPAKRVVDEEPIDPTENPLTRALRRAGRLLMPATPSQPPAASEPVAANTEARDDVTLTRAVDLGARMESPLETLPSEGPRDRRHVTREFPSPLRFPKPASIPAPAKSDDAQPPVRAQSKIRAQVAEAAARRSSSL